jgi:transcriptional antiterminator RfaH
MAGKPKDAPAPATSQESWAWYCVRSQLRHEHIAAAHLVQDLDLAVFLPRIRFRRLTRQGSRRVTEPLFPAYLFARFKWAEHLRAVQHARGVAQVVHFGERWPTVPDEVIDLLRGEVGSDEIHEVRGELRAGDEVRLVGGAMHGLSAVVTHALPARQRVAVLLEFLGRQVKVEVAQEGVLPEGPPRI